MYLLGARHIVSFAKSHLTDLGMIMYFNTNENYVGVMGWLWLVIVALPGLFI